MKPTRGLGKGLSALFSETEEDYGKSLLFDEAENDAREKGLYHGECVALGMLPMCAPPLRARLLPILASLGLPTACTLEKDKVLDAMMHDKKAEKNGIGAVLVDKIGSFRFETLSRDALAARIADAFPEMQ